MIYNWKTEENTRISFVTNGVFLRYTDKPFIAVKILDNSILEYRWLVEYDELSNRVIRRIDKPRVSIRRYWDDTQDRAQMVTQHYFGYPIPYSNVRQI